MTDAFTGSGRPAQADAGFDPAQAQAIQLEKIAADMRTSLRKNQPDGRPDDQHGEYSRHNSNETTGPLREIMHRQDSLYKYLNWEDPLRTLGSYFLALGVLSAAHYFPWTRTALKYASITLGVVSATEFANRTFTKNTLLARLRPRQYQTLDESTLNATLRDIHDLLQHLTVVAQKTILGEDLSSTFISFITLTALYWFSNLLSPFGIAILALTTAYIVPLFATPRGQAVARDAQAQAERLGAAAAENTKHLANQGQEKLSQGYAKVQDGAAETRQYAGDVLASTRQTAANAADTTRHQAGDALQSGRQTAANLTNRASDAAIGTKNQAGSALESGRQTAADAANTTRQQAGNAIDSGRQTAANLTSRASDAAIGTKHQAGNAFESGTQSAADASSRAQEVGSQGAQSAAQGASKLPFVNRDTIDSAFGTGNQGGGQAQGNDFGTSRGDLQEEILDHSKVQADLRGGVDKVPF